MSNQVVANRYADALFQLAKEKNQLEAVTSDLQLVKEVAESTPQLMRYLSHPKVTNKEKQEFIRKSFGQALTEISLQALFLLIDRKRVDNLIPMIHTFQSLAYEARGMAEAVVYSAKALTEEEQKQVEDTFAKKANKSKLVIRNIVNSDLIGGIKIRIGDYIYDGSIKAQLDRLKRELVTGTR